MKVRRIFAIATVLTLAAAIGVPSVTAQSLGLKSDIPFDFRVDGKVFPAGTYTLSQTSPEVVRLRDAKGNAVFITGRKEILESKKGSWLLFHQYGDVRFLAGAYWADSLVSLTVPASRAEREVAKSKGQQSPITIAAR